MHHIIMANQWSEQNEQRLSEQNVQKMEIGLKMEKVPGNNI